MSLNSEALCQCLDYSPFGFHKAIIIIGQCARMLPIDNPQFWLYDEFEGVSCGEMFNRAYECMTCVIRD